MIVLADSDILIEVLRSRDPSIHSRWRSLAETGDPVLYSPVSAAEIWAGARPNEHSEIARLFQSLLCIPVDSEIGRLAGGMLLLFARSHGVKIADALIAASAVHHRAALWTRNRKHYPIPQLTFY